MSIISGGGAVVGAGGAAGPYEIERSLRFNFADSTYLNRTPASATNRTTWTYSYWFKSMMLKPGVNDYWAFSAFNDGNNYTAIRHHTEYYIDVISFNAGSAVSIVKTQQVFRDPSAWNHMVIVFDTGNATQSDRVRIYHNGIRADIRSGATYPGSGSPTGWINSTNIHYIGRLSTEYFDGYMTEINFIDGQALNPTSFGEYNEDTGVWQPIEYTGSYGTNGFYLNFSDNSGTTSTTLGKDYSGNGNNWTPNNFSVTAGAGNDSLVDTPTSYGTDTGAGGEVRGNYATWNVLVNNSTLSNGNLQIAGGGSTVFYGSVSTIGISSGQWYWEITNVSNTDGMTGIIEISQAYAFAGATPSGTTYVGYQSRGYAYHANGNKYNNASSSAYGATYTTNDIIGVAFDADAGTLVFYKNGVSQGTAYTVASGYSWFPADNVYVSDSKAVNFGQRPFAYTAPSGFKALCTQNLPEPTIVAGNEYFDATTYSGQSTSLTVTNSGSMQPDFVWIKSRNSTDYHNLIDAVRGTNKNLFSNATDAEETAARLTSFNSNGITLAGGYGNTNNSGQNYVAWQWRASNATAVTNTAGSITSTVSANTTSGFSIVTYTGNGTDNATVGHGLGVKPAMVIIKNRDDGGQCWNVWHQSFAAETYFIWLNATNSVFTSYTTYQKSHSSTTFTLGTNIEVNQTSAKHVAYCFAPVAGYSAFGSYTGNGAGSGSGTGDGPFVFTGFSPRWIMVKVSSGTTANWSIIDTARSPYNFADKELWPSSSVAEQTYAIADILSNGFKLRSDSGQWNTNGAVYIYAAFAESPFKYSLAR